MRTLLRLAVLALAALGAKTLYDRVAPHADEYRERATRAKDAGADLVGKVGESAKDTARTMADDATELADEIGDHVEEATEEIRAATSPATADA